ncbi:hypothetical protein HYQ46_010271 [Verticillium longisporum]|nr:hypothetical protein HYQ46_010271 [Verticillium longisporum]
MTPPRATSHIPTSCCAPPSPYSITFRLPPSAPPPSLPTRLHALASERNLHPLHPPPGISQRVITFKQAKQGMQNRTFGNRRADSRSLVSWQGPTGNE